MSAGSMNVGTPRKIDDPLLRAAVLDLYRASQAFGDAFREGGASVEQAAKDLDAARERVWTAQTLGKP